MKHEMNPNLRIIQTCYKDGGKEYDPRALGNASATYGEELLKHLENHTSGIEVPPHIKQEIDEFLNSLNDIEKLQLLLSALSNTIEVCQTRIMKNKVRVFFEE